MPSTTIIGRRLGVREVQALLGAGGMGEVYRARDTRLGRDVAIKVFELPPSGWLDFEPAPDGRLLAIVPYLRGSAQPITMIANWRPPQ